MRSVVSRVRASRRSATAAAETATGPAGIDAAKALGSDGRLRCLRLVVAALAVRFARVLRGEAVGGGSGASGASVTSAGSVEGADC